MSQCDCPSEFPRRFNFVKSTTPRDAREDKRLWRKLVLLYHPDKRGGTPETTKDFQDLQNYWDEGYRPYDPSVLHTHEGHSRKRKRDEEQAKCRKKRTVRFRNWDDKYKFYRNIQVEGGDEIRNLPWPGPMYKSGPCEWWSLYMKYRPDDWGPTRFSANREPRKYH